LDPKGTKRGPFAGKTMVQWYDAGLLPEDLAVRHSQNMGFSKIREMFPAPMPPFRTRPGTKKVEPTPPPFTAGLQMGGTCNSSWHYIDTKGNVQGPFLSHQLQVWYEHKMLPKELKLRRTTDPSNTYALIVDFFPRPLLPFQSQPVTPPVMRIAQLQNPQDSTNGTPVGKQVSQTVPSTVPTTAPPSRSTDHCCSSTGTAAGTATDNAAAKGKSQVCPGRQRESETGRRARQR
jgi:hypothetical protein